MKTFFLLLIALFASCTKDSSYQQEAVVDRTTYIISGKVFWEGNLTDGVGNVLIQLSGPENQSMTTSADGLYSFSVSTPGIYTITPTKTSNLLNGVTGSGGDATLIQQYVAGLTTLTTYQIIAADANKNNTITTLDASIINQATLGNPSAQNILKPSWTFVDKSYSFGLVPPIPNYPKTVTVNVNSDVFNVDFIGIKRGDVNSSCNPAL